MVWHDFFKRRAANRSKDERELELPSSLRLSSYAKPTVHTPKRSRAYKDSYLNRRKTIKLIDPFQNRNVVSEVQKVSEKLCVKFGSRVQLSEAWTLEFLRKHTSIPVPKVYCAFEGIKGRKYILMEHIDGEPIGDKWAEKSEAEKESLIAQLKAIFEELRNIKHPRPGILAGVDMQALFDPRCWKGYLGFGPFAKESDFNHYLHCGMKPTSIFFSEKEVPWVTNEERAEVRKLLEMQESKQHKICFTHGDANSSNILVKNGKIVALIDFEVSGWYPEYWEYTTAMNVNRYDGFWKAVIPKFLAEYPEELEMEALRRKHFGAMGFRGSIPME
ncbi:hypothetical protein LSUE1_G010020 [Lachnellula suecica]|uniref:Aminoglycoside phosphotransferase domain-containing protein n=1 Tax=Lachnellula suecica TaxID=602035 RepID=A0A8T9BYG0_9HELO|nr:hypothetical protein LSUE1_G010020 [Lachnellula suecica]